MFWLKLTARSLKNRKLTVSLSLITIALSVCLLLTIDRLGRETRMGFTQAVSQVDLLVGARSGPLQLLLYSIFNVGQATHNMSYESYRRWAENPAVAWTIPLSLGDGHRGFRVVGTSTSLFEHYRFRRDQELRFARGQEFSGLWEIVLGSEVARQLNYDLGAQVIVGHGSTLGEGMHQHEEAPFTVVGILHPTGTPIDRGLYISLQAMEALHFGWESGQYVQTEASRNLQDLRPEDVQVKSLTSFLLRTQSRLETLSLQRQISNDPKEPLMAVVPGVALSQLWRTLGSFENVLSWISYLVFLVSLSVLLIGLLFSLLERRREMALLRALGASGTQLGALSLFEGLLVSFAGLLLGFVLYALSFGFVGAWLSREYGIVFVGSLLEARAFIFAGLVLVFAALVALVPALWSRRQILKEGLKTRF